MTKVALKLAGTPVVSDCPEHLSDDARREWDRLVPELERLGWLASVDRAALAGYCQAWGRWVEAERGIAEFGMLIKGPMGFPVQSPLVAIANKALELMHKFEAECWLTPRSRDRRRTATEPADDGPAYDEQGRPSRAKARGWLR